ncbi:ABC transporter substrate-binding protein [Marinobacter sp. HL-58]|uniref:ABC transporter substrate-binding protein n=1 Tax=Marinobacter sp. HL-58 TaxID=1479237 RepID=UPI000690E08D|nr:ABC transporter substrate-binding protein [Marinobacter sp. HL-58]KPQ02918.1 MAG: ABC-type iron(III) uptake system substrate-binding component FbpA [Marinobacter sp. HL-58]
MRLQHPKKLFSFLLLLVTVPLVSPATAFAEELTVYTAGPRALIDALVRDFREQTGTRVNVFQSSTGQVMARLESERSRPNADVVISASWDSAAALKEGGELLEYTPKGADQVPDDLRDSHYIAQGIAALGLVWNRDSDVPEPADWRDLADPEYRDQVTMPDPSQSGAAFQLLTGLLGEYGEEETWALMQSLRDNGMLVPGPNARALNPVLQGAKSVVFGAVDYIALGQRANGERIEVIFPESGTVLSPRPMMILKSTDNPEAAKAFMDFMLSEAGQAHVADRYLIPARGDVEGKRPGLDELKQLEVDSDAMNIRRKEIIENFREATEG